ELDQVIFDGSFFGTATPAGSEEEADYLGIPGLLDADQMRDLLRRRQEEQITRRTASGEVPRVSTHGQLRELRRELNALVSIAHHRTGKPHGWIHNELRRICGGPPIAAATTDQLKARIEAVRTLQACFRRAYRTLSGRLRAEIATRRAPRPVPPDASASSPGAGRQTAGSRCARAKMAALSTSRRSARPPFGRRRPA